MEKEEIRIDTPFAVAGITIIPVVKASSNCWQNKGQFSFMGMKQPVSIVVVSPQARRAFRVTGEEIPLDQLTEEVPGIKEALDGL